MVRVVEELSAVVIDLGHVRLQILETPGHTPESICITAYESLCSASSHRPGVVMRFRFNEFELDQARHELRLQGKTVPLQPRVLSLLFYLVERADRVVSKIELIDEVWEHAIVVEAVLTRAISVLRATLGDADRDRRLIVTVPGIGYRFAAPVEALTDDRLADTAPTPGEGAPTDSSAPAIDSTDRA